MDVLRSLLVRDHPAGLRWEVKGRDSHERHWNSVRIVCALILWDQVGRTAPRTK